jgi:hypothetical protein
MRMVRYTLRGFLFFAIFAVVFPIGAQELRCNVSVVAPSIQGSNRKVFETMQTALNEFMNSQRWTEKVYAPEERIECNVMLNIKEMVSIDEFKGTLQIQARRPVHNSSYTTVLFNYQDQNLSFNYVEFEPLVFSPNNFQSNLVAMMSYYAYVIIGLDEDSFAPLGGTSSFQKADQIVNRAQSALQPGWKAYESQRNRYWLIENMMNEYHKPLRECMYKYHRLGLDQMAAKVETGRAEIANAIELLKKVHNQKPGSFLMQVFFMAKSDEIINVFSESFGMEKSRVATLLIELDPSNADKYKALTSK